MGAYFNNCASALHYAGRIKCNIFFWLNLAISKVVMGSDNLNVPILCASHYDGIVVVF